jgi:GH24 family phage-related lysozyme (muramidase)
MMIINTLDKLLTLDEGDNLKPYKDPRGIWTIGKGHNLVANGMPAGILPEGVTTSYPGCLGYLQTHGLTQAQDDQLFHYDILHVCGFLLSFPWFKLMDVVRQAAVQDMAFNLGEHTFREFTGFCGYLAQGDFNGAAADLRTTAVFRELPTRYSRLAAMIETGKWPVIE